MPISQLAIDTYHIAATAFVELRENYRLAYATAWLSAEGKTLEAKKNAADSATSSMRLIRDKAEIDMVIAWQRLLDERGPIGESIPPLQKFGDV